VLRKIFLKTLLKEINVYECMQISFLTFLDVCSVVVHCFLINIAQASTSEQTRQVHSANISENIPLDGKPLPDIDPKDMELFEAAAREAKEIIEPKLLTGANVTRKVTHNLPSVRIRGDFGSLQSDKGPFCGR
jgi:hypothetical protein